VFLGSNGRAHRCGTAGDPSRYKNIIYGKEVGGFIVVNNRFFIARSFHSGNNLLLAKESSVNSVRKLDIIKGDLRAFKSTDVGLVLFKHLPKLTTNNTIF